MKKHYITKAAITVLVASLAYGNPAWAESDLQTGAQTAATTTGKLRFPDVPSAHWATKYITKLSLLGIVEGNELGQYEPESSVTQEQVITMLVRMLGWEKEALSLPAFYSELGVSDYAKPYLYTALEKGLIVQSEELSLPGSGIWGQRNASREWVAKLVIKGIGKQAEAEKLALEASSFTDNGSISDWARGYINEAVALKIVNGMEDGSFKPKNPVTRAEMATFLSRGSQYSEAVGKAVLGVVESVTQQGIVIVNELGDRSTYSLPATSVYYGLNQDTPSSVSALKQNSRVFLVVSEGAVQYAEVLEEESQSLNTLEGTLVRLDISTAQLVLMSGGQEVTANIQVPLTITDADGKGMSSSALEPGSVLELQRTGSRAKYSSIIVKHIPLNKTAEGTIQSVDLVTRKLYVLETDVGAVEYPLADNVLYLNVGAAGDMSTLKARDKISYRITADYVTQIDMVTAYEEPSDSGKMINLQLDKDYSYITLQKSDNKPAIYNVLEKAEVVIPGVAYATFNDLVVNDQVKVMLDENNDVYKIFVTNRSMKTEYLNTIVTFDTDSKLLTVRNSAGTAKLYELTDQVSFEVNGTSVNYATGLTYLTKGRKVDVTSSSETNVKSIRIVYGYEGTVTRVSTVQNEITLNLEDQQLTLKVSSGMFIDVPNITGAKLMHISPGDYVKIAMDSTNNTANRIQVVKTFVYRVTGKDAVTRGLSVKNEANTSSTVYVPSTVKIYNLAKSEIALTDMILEDPYYITFTGSIVEKVEAAPVSRGNVISVDAAGGKITVSEAGGANKTVTVGTGAVVKRDGISGQTTLADLKPGDRVEAIGGMDGTYTLHVASMITRQVDYYDAVTNSLYVLRDSLNETRSYTLHARVYIHKGIATLLPVNIASRDKVNIYLMGGKIIELEKI
ncbi:MAG: S-layer protein [Paenibacillaceae bacterium]|jgi:Cu/Ag efflux protein CusF|nr:S-layer protein [Paenibacillaceae bacterium]